jgi:hypothetical protein
MENVHCLGMRHNGEDGESAVYGYRVALFPTGRGFKEGKKICLLHRPCTLSYIEGRRGQRAGEAIRFLGSAASRLS